MADDIESIGTGDGRRIACYSLGFVRQKGLRRILQRAGWRLVPGWPPLPADAVAVWGRRAVAERGIAAARRRGMPLLTIEDAFLRSIGPGQNEVPAGLLLDFAAPFFDAATPSQLEAMLEAADLSDPALLARAGNAIAFLRFARLSKYNAWSRSPPPAAGYVLVVDQTRGDAAIAHGSASPADFTAMLAAARAEHPGRPILIRQHPRTAAGERGGHFGPGDADERTALSDDAINPWDALDAAHAVYCVTSQLGFEAILAGHRPIVFGQPFYAGWGLSDDRRPISRRTRRRTAPELAAAALLRYPLWYDAARDRPCGFEDAARGLAARARAADEDRQGWVCTGIRAWKRPHLRAFLAEGPRPIFEGDPARAAARARRTGRKVLVWAREETPALIDSCAAAQVPLARIEDGFLRSVGLGARLVPPASVVIDDLGIYYDPGRPSRLEALIAAAASLPDVELQRAAALRAAIAEGEVSKYNLGGASQPAAQPGRRVILVAGQVEDDASILAGATDIRSNLELVRAAREAEPDAFIIYKPHPDVVAGLRPGAITQAALATLVDQVMPDASPSGLINRVDGVWTITSALGFEALLRGKPVTCLGQPFYAGWGLSDDHAGAPARRSARPTLDQITHAALIGYPRYRDPVSGLVATPEVVVERLAARAPEAARNPRATQRLLSRAQDRLARYSRWWR